MAPRKRNDRGSGSNAGTVFWLAAIVIVLFIFALNWGKIQATLARTNFHEIVKTQTDKPSAAPSAPSSPASPELPPKSDGRASAPKPAAASPQAAPQPASGSPVASPDLSPDSSPGGAKPEPGAAPQPRTVDKSAGARAAQDQKAPNEAQGAKGLVSAQGARTRPASLFFVRIDDDGVIVRQEVKRQVSVSDSPLLDSLGALLQGPSEDELRKNLISLVPQGTKLLSAQVRGSTAYLNFNEAFMYNHYGIEGYAGQLKQIVYTSTAFPTVQDVQILIEGQKRDYLGGEGVYIGRPLSRNSF
jgi:germination protein M